MYRILVAEDDYGIRETIKEFLEKRDFVITEAVDGAQAIRLIDEKEFDVALLDVMMPGADGFHVCKVIREKSDIPVIFITARTAEEDQLRGFQMKADDYITKPFSLPILHAKIMALIQRNLGTMRGNILEATGIRVDKDKHEVYIDEKMIDMPPKVYSLLVYFLENKNQILTRNQIMNHIWGDDTFFYDRVVDTTIKKLRNLLGSHAGCIKTIIKVGYKFQERGYEK